MARRLMIALLCAAAAAMAAGRGLYCVTGSGPANPDPACSGTNGGGGSYSTIAAALAALKTDQGANPFTAAQTIRVYSGTYGAIGDTFVKWPGKLTPTAAYPLTIAAAADNLPVINCGSATVDGITLYSPYVTIGGFEITNCRYAVSFGTGGDYATIRTNHIHDVTGYAAIYGAPSYAYIHHNYIHDVPRGMMLGGNVEAAFNEIAHTTAGNLISSNTGSSSIHDNIAYNGYVVNASGIWASHGDAVTNNVTYSNRYGIQSQVTTAPGPTITGNISVNNLYDCHCEGAPVACYMDLIHNFCYRATNGQAIRQNAGTGAATSTIKDNISWANATINSLDKNIFVSSAAQLAVCDYNSFWKTGPALTGQSANTTYATLSAWHAATGLDAHSIEADPRVVGKVDLLATTAQICPPPACTTIEQRLAYIRRNYAPTNLLLKRAGDDHADIGPVPITIYNAPGITGGGVY